MAEISEGEYKGKPVLKIIASENSKYPLIIGLWKAGVIVDNFEAIKQFKEKHTKPPDNDPTPVS